MFICTHGSKRDECMEVYVYMYVIGGVSLAPRGALLVLSLSSWHETEMHFSKHKWKMLVTWIN